MIFDALAGKGGGETSINGVGPENWTSGGHEQILLIGLSLWCLREFGHIANKKFIVSIFW